MNEDFVYPSQFERLKQFLHPYLHWGAFEWYNPLWQQFTYPTENTPVKPLEQLARYSQFPLFNLAEYSKSFRAEVVPDVWARFYEVTPAHFNFVIHLPETTLPTSTASTSTAQLQAQIAYQAHHLYYSTIQPTQNNLQHKLGYFLFHLNPPSSHYSRGYLQTIYNWFDQLMDFISPLTGETPIAVNIAHRSLWTPPIFELLQKHQLTLAITIHPKYPSVLESARVYQQIMERVDAYRSPLVVRWFSQSIGATLVDLGLKGFQSEVSRTDILTRAHLTHLIQQATHTRRKVFMTIHDRAEGAAPLTIVQMTQRLFELSQQRFNAR